MKKAVGIILILTFHILVKYKYNNRIRYLLCAIDLFSKYAWVVPLKDRKGVTIVNAFKKFQTVQKENQTKYGLIKVVNFITVFFKKWQRHRSVFNTQ